MRSILVAAVTLWAVPPRPREATYVFQSEEDPSTPPDPTVCAGAPFFTNAQLGASLYSVKTSRRNGRVTEHRKKIGRATACLGLTNLLFPAGLVQNFFVRFDLPQGAYRAGHLHRLVERRPADVPHPRRLHAEVGQRSGRNVGRNRHQQLGAQPAAPARLLHRLDLDASRVPDRRGRPRRTLRRGRRGLTWAGSR